MGTKAYVEFPIYSHHLEGGDTTDLKLVWDDEVGKVFVYTQYDGDTFPDDLQQAIKLWLLEEHEWPGRNPAQIPSFEEQVAWLDPEVCAAQLLRRIFDDVPNGHFRISCVEPEAGFHLIFDVKAGMVNYCGQSERDVSILTWLQCDSGLIFTADPQDYRELTPEEEAGMEEERRKMAMILADPQEEDEEDEDID